MTDENFELLLLCNGSWAQCLPPPTPSGIVVNNAITSITSTTTFYVRGIKQKHGYTMTLDISGVAGTNATLSISMQLPNYPQYLTLTPVPITTTGTFKMWISEDGEITAGFYPSSGNPQFWRLGKISLTDLWNLAFQFTVGGTSPSFTISAGYIIAW